MPNQITEKVQSPTLELQRAAMISYEGNEYDGQTITDGNAARRLRGDTLALFIWREARDAGGDREELCRMLRTAVRELEEVANALNPTQAITLSASTKPAEPTSPDAGAAESLGTTQPGESNTPSGDP